MVAKIKQRFWNTSRSETLTKVIVYDCVGFQELDYATSFFEFLLIFPPPRALSFKGWIKN